MAVNRWCMQCALDPEYRRERPAVGVDEDGEPACFEHQTKTGESKASAVDGTTSEAGRGHHISASAPAQSVGECSVTEPAKVEAAPQKKLASKQRKALMPEKKVCAAPGCNAELRSNNRKGRCRAHSYIPTSERGRAPRGRRTSQAIVRVEPASVVAPDCANLDLIGLRDRLRSDLAAVERVIELGLRA